MLTYLLRLGCSTLMLTVLTLPAQAELSNQTLNPLQFGMIIYGVGAIGSDAIQLSPNGDQRLPNNVTTAGTKHAALLRVFDTPGSTVQLSFNEATPLYAVNQQSATLSQFTSNQPNNTCTIGGEGYCDFNIGAQLTISGHRSGYYQGAFSVQINELPTGESSS